MLPRERRLTSDQEGHVQRLMKMKDNKKEIMFLSGHPVLLKDINNIVAKGKMNQTRNQLESAVTLLQDIYGAGVTVSTNEKEFLRGMFFQDQSM